MRLLYVCLLTATIAAQSPSTTGWVVIPVNEYSWLRGKAFPTAADPESRPIDATLTRVEYELRADGEIASGRATLTIDVLKDGWVRVPVPAGLMVREARLEGKLVALVRGGNTLSALLTKRGRSVLQLDIAMPIAPGAGE